MHKPVEMKQLLSLDQLHDEECDRIKSFNLLLKVILCKSTQQIKMLSTLFEWNLFLHSHAYHIFIYENLYRFNYFNIIFLTLGGQSNSCPLQQ